LFFHILLNERELQDALDSERLKNNIDNKNACRHNEGRLLVGQKIDDRDNNTCEMEELSQHINLIDFYVITQKTYHKTLHLCNLCRLS
jgi:hypothetical protein